MSSTPAHRPRRRPKPKHRSLVAPSQAILTLLAAITPTSAAPTPDFLCPSLINCPLPTDPAIPSRTLRRRAPYQFAGADAASIPTGTAALPVKFVESQDGNWYPATDWSLHGKSKHQLPALPSTSTSAPTRTHPPGLDIADDIADIPVVSTTSTTTSASPTGTQLPDITDSLPTGWKPTPHRTRFYSIPLIVGFSLVLAVSITLCLAATVLWHRNRSAARDVEKARLRKQLRAADGGDDGDDGDGDEAEGEGAEEVVRALQEAQRRTAKRDKMWTRWRREARIGLRRRKRTRPRPDMEEEAEAEAEAQSRASTSRRASIVSVRSDVSIPISTVEPAPPPPPAPRTPPLPPAYRRSSRTNPAKGEGSARWPIILPPDPDEDAPARPSISSDGAEDELLPTVSAHVATDDKAVLERMRHQASEPQLGEGDASGAGGHGAAEAEADAPRWEDERLEDFEDADADLGAGPSTGACPPLRRPFQLRLPSPPPPALLPEPGSDGEGGDPSLPYYAPRFDVPVPSSPPYELDEAAVVPSAPPEEEEEAEEEGEILLAPSAPPLDEDEESIEDVNAKGGGGARRDHDARSDHAPPSLPTSPPRNTSPSSSSASHVVLPRYEP